MLPGYLLESPILSFCFFHLLLPYTAGQGGNRQREFNGPKIIAPKLRRNEEANERDAHFPASKNRAAKQKPLDAETATVIHRLATAACLLRFRNAPRTRILQS